MFINLPQCLIWAKTSVVKSSYLAKSPCFIQRYRLCFGMRYFNRFRFRFYFCRLCVKNSFQINKVVFPSVTMKFIYIYKTQSLSVCMSAIEIKLETFRYKQTYESYITFSREAKYDILISIRIVYGGLRAYIYSTYINSM